MNKNPYYIYDEISGTELIIYKNSVLSYSLHNHSSVFSLGMILKGSVSLYKNKKFLIYRTGEIFTIPPYVPHALNSKENCSILTICINKNKISKTDIDILIERINFLYSEKFNLGYLTSNSLSHLAEKISECKDFYESKPVVSQIKNLRQLLENHPETCLNIDKMSELSYMSKYHFIRKFKEEVGLTPHQFQIQNKIRKAQKILNNYSNTSETALNTGFFDQSHFTRYFKKITGLTPGAYKKAFISVKN